MSRVELRPQFVSGSAGELFVLMHVPVGHDPVRRRVLFVPPFGEELNKSRRMLHLQAVALAKHGVVSALLDLYGTGDSDGEFAEATWQQWVRDLDVALETLRQGTDAEVVYIGLRMGALLALEHASLAEAGPARLIAWHPWTAGRAEIDNLLRMRVVADTFAGRSDVSVPLLRRELEAGRAIDVGGYELNPALLAALDGKHISPLLEHNCLLVDWIDVGATDGHSLAPGRAKALEGLPIARMPRVRVIAGEKFWSTAEITTCTKLISVTTELLVSE